MTMEHQFDFHVCRELARQAAAEGCVLLENHNECLPLEPRCRAAVFGRIQLNYYKSGAGSGGLVNTDYTVNIVEGLQNSGKVLVDQALLETYRHWVEENPFDYGTGWAQEPRCQVEMPLGEDVARAAAERSDVAIVILGRLAGEDFDHTAEAGSYYLTDTELAMLRTVRAAFSRMAVLLNVGNVIDLGWSDEIRPDALMLVWQGGQEGGSGVADVLTGQVNPSGRLCDTVARRLEDHPAHGHFGDAKQNDYAEDIYLGYRWFETFAPHAVRYPFGYGLSYTRFQIGAGPCELDGDRPKVRVRVANRGTRAGREVVQLYVRQPQGALGKPALALVDFGKTGLLAPGEEQVLEFEVDWYRLASYDDSGASGRPYCYVLEAGPYELFAGQNARTLLPVGTLSVPEARVVRQCRQALAPTKTFQRRTAGGWEPVPTRNYELARRIADELPKDIAHTGDLGYKLADVLAGKVDMAAFLAQLDDGDLAAMCCGEGMSSPKVTPGTGGAFGGVTDRLLQFGIPVVCCTDGPSGIRMDSGAKAFSHPCGTLLACTFDKELNEKLFEQVGAEMSKLRIEVLLGPGMNLHRYPLNGRNFEYFSEDPVLTGEIGAAQLCGLHSQGVTGCIKHFCANNQESHRRAASSNLSERALRELYLKGFEIAVKEGGADCVMTTYGAVNGIWTAGNYDLNTTVLRGEWGYTGVVMTDWWADINEEGQAPSMTNGGCMVRAQNDMYMVCSDASASEIRASILSALAEGGVTRGQLARNAANICRFAMNTRAMDRLLHPEQYARNTEEASADTGFFAGDVEFVTVRYGESLDLSGVCTDKGKEKLLAVQTERHGPHWYTLTVSSQASELAQMPVTVFVGASPAGTHVVHGTQGRPVTFAGCLFLNGTRSFLRLRFGQSGIHLHSITFHEQEP